ncbi:MAG TPA: CDP-alcohol phosphatidyltransferase [Jeotgalicoccus sp.]|nr:CDP-alcohol phosphatidyltransferase [Jeotgalicoccus sp.]
MISIYELKPKFQQMLMPLVNLLHKNHVTPNQVTISACLLSILIGVLFYFNYESSWIYAVIPVFMFVRMAMNAIDGVLAKKFNLQSRLGKFLNELTDVISDTALFIPFLLLTQTFQASVIIFISLSIISEMAGVLSEVNSGERRYDGPMGKSDRAFLIGAVAVLLLFNVPLEPYLHIVFIIASVLIAVNIYKRAAGGLEETQ